jgi:unsaturated chondroitin disaccharide hydrolase
VISLAEKCEKAFGLAARQLRHTIETYPDQFPMYTQNGKWAIGGEAWTNWCEGFLGGQLWLLYEHTGEAYWRDKGMHYSRLIEDRKTDRTVHDLGFLFWPTWQRWYALTGEPAVQEVVIQAGQTLALRFKEKGQYLRSFVSDESCFVDIMMNVGIIFYAAEELGDEELWRIARQHCLTTRRYLVRGDGSTVHEGIFDTETGAFMRESTHQGWRGDASWARGLAWALYGFGTAYEFTGDARFLNTAEACAAYYVEHTPEHGVPPNDWCEPDPPRPYESSAAAIAAGGFLNLAEFTQDPVRARFYDAYARRILDTLTEPEFLAVETPGWEGILKHGEYHRAKGLGVDESVMWGEYYFLEALSRVLV